MTFTEKLRSWVRQPTTLNGLGAALGTVAGALAWHFTKSTTDTIGAIGFAFSAVHLGINDNSTMPTDVEKLAIDAATAVAQRRMAAAFPGLFVDLSAVAADVVAKADVVTVSAPVTKVTGTLVTAP